ncbi:hypothetical protein GRI58_04630 [Porphyrobacter algicida]|uniref:Uncharacterized protein n=1 Tax=Qipengyuania algicida TaxID=1836209 RepID=A0A845AF49_9SPHN|nr:hypothetical protein [Qipengyuania algicida]MXP28107.1 hypothetical protein [Qipengyuania algicida]
MADLPLPGAFVRANPLPFPRAIIEQQVEALIAFLDAADGDPDIEDGDEDCCPAYDDRPYSMGACGDLTGGAGDLDDAEEDDPSGQCDEDGINTSQFLTRNCGPGCIISDSDHAYWD